jgi:predicted nuclease with TOPRIM domain
MPGMHMVSRYSQPLFLTFESDLKQRRRAQNRASQRAFRERKEKHVKGLEHQLEDLHEKHQDLLQSYARQTDEVSKLNNRISELDAELTTLRSCHDRSYDDMLMPDRFDKFDHFDAFSLHDTLYSGPYLDKSGVDLDSESAYHNFEDSL